MPNTEYGSDKRYGYPFGEGRNYTIPAFIRTNAQKVALALQLGWSSGCPIARELTGSNSPYDVEWLMRRYAETNYWFRETVNRAWRNNKAVFDLLARPRVRLLEEPVGKHESLSVPNSHKWRISPMSALEGYATPRVLIEVRGGTNNLESTIRVGELLVESLKDTGEQPWHFLAILSRNAVRYGAEPERVLHHVYPAGILQEENCRTTYINLEKSLETNASTVWRALLDLPQSQRVKLEIAEIPSSS